MAATHRFILTTSDGEHLTELTAIESVQYSRFVNNPGWFMLIIDPDLDPSLLDIDRLIEFWRQPEGGEDRLEMVGFLRYWDWFENAPRADRLRLGGPDQADLLDRRVIAYKSTTAQAKKTDEADDLIKEIVRENLGPDAAVTEAGRPRAYDPDHFTIAGNTSQAPEVTRSFAWRNVLDVLQEISESSRELGTPLFFDLIPSAGATFEFRTYINVRGIDRTDPNVASVVFSREYGNLSNPFLREDWREERNYVWGGGQGQGTARTIDPEKSLPRIFRSIWGKREVFQDAREEATIQGVANKAFERLQNDRPRSFFRGELLDTPRSRYGIDWDFGDKVTVRYKGREFYGDIRSIGVTIDSNGLETVRAGLEIDNATG